MYIDSREKVTARYQVNLWENLVHIVFYCLIILFMLQRWRLCLGCSCPTVDLSIKERSNGVWKP